MTTDVKAYDDIVDLFARGTSPQEILQFRPSQAVQRRAEYLMNRCKVSELSELEAAELEQMGQLEHLMQLVKARAHLYQKDMP